MFLKLWNRLLARLRHRDLDREVQDELAFHLEMQTQANIDRGMAPDQAQREARIALGGVEQMKESVRDARWTWFDSTWQDVRYAFRTLGRSPGFAATAIITLALGIGANVAIFSVVDAALFRPMPYKDADRLVYVYRTAMGIDGRPRPGVVVNGRLVDVVRSFTRVFEGLEVTLEESPRALATGGVDQSMLVGGFGPGLPALLGVTPRIGRGFTEDDVASQDTIVLSDGFWQRGFQRDPSVLGKKIVFADRSCLVVGVMPPAFRYLVGAQADAWLPVGDHDGARVLARLRPGLTIPQAQRLLDAEVARLPPRQVPLVLQIVPANWQRADAPPGWIDRSPRLMLFCLMGAVAFVLLIACANVANLLLARALTRHSEIAVRSALGATRGRLIRQFLIEAFVLAGLGGLVAAIVAWYGIRAIPLIVPGKLIPSLLGVGLPQLDLRVAAFGGGTVLIAALCAGVIPAWRASRLALLDGLQAGGQRIAGSGGQRPVRRIFQALQIALTLVLLVCAGLFVRSVFQMVNIPTGFDPAGLAYVELGFPPQSFAIQSQRVAFAEQMVSRLSVMPGVQGVTVGPPPVSNLTTMRRWEPDGDSTRAVDMTTRLFWVAPDYFRVAGIRLTEGRTFGSQNGDTGEQVVIISENAARRLWPGRSAVGGRLRSGQQVYTVVGVVPHLRTLGFTDDGAELFYPITQRDVGGTGLLMRVTEKSAAVASVRALARALDSRVTIKRIGTVNQLFADSDPFGSPGFYAVLLGALAGLGLLTASVGLYGLMSFAVSQRAHEIGVRIALGADSASVRRLLIGDALAPVALGIIVGLVAATWLSKFVASQLFRVTPHDLTTFSVIVVLLVLVCGLALSRPVRRAAHIAPVDALRHE